MVSFTRHERIDYCIDASEMKSLEKSLSVHCPVPCRRAVAALPLPADWDRAAGTGTEALGDALYWNSDTGTKHQEGTCLRIILRSKLLINI
ncbi:unnamed protein product [Euphydryas editha]|uniref:Uncharacterized protein n=1 Tax=Euphydryas editha TaxID=104508 RepID=A0AAU9VFY8_EUPED|nr:unnamed protein product [Euphydryas editha]